MTTKQPDLSDINALAIEACDMWQEHLSTLASDPKAREELTRFLEPQRRLFADWAAMMQQGGSYGNSNAKAEPSSGESPADAASSAKPDPSVGAAAATASGDAAHGNDPLRVAQLALRLAELEKRVAQLESRPTGAPPHY
ncbi:MAG: hypothetical protein P4M13_00720 [Alphaproteobacteria bacterium]|nr:hypothetical protein [Alphaproteobacteria bacterium]